VPSEVEKQPAGPREAKTGGEDVEKISSLSTFKHDVGSLWLVLSNKDMRSSQRLVEIR